MKNPAKYFRLTVGLMVRQYEPKYPKTNFPFDNTHINFFIADLLSLLRVWTALQHNQLTSYGVAKWHENSIFKEQYIIHWLWRC